MKNNDNNQPPVSNRIRFGVLLLLCMQNAGHALVAKYSQKSLKEKFSSSEVVLISEVIKVIVSTFLVIYEKSELDGSVGGGLNKLLWLLFRSEKMILLVIIYSINNLLAYVALGNVEAAVYTVLSQLKILTTAASSVLILGRTISGTKWRALILLVLGCILVASPVFNKCEDTDAKSGGGKAGGDDEVNASFLTTMIGVSAVLVMVVNSGFASVYLEGVLKKDNVTVWERNFQLSFYSMFLMLGIIFSEKYFYGEDVMRPLFQGWTFSAVTLAFIQAAGGLLVAAALKYADSILKTLATCLAIVLSAVFGYSLMSDPLDMFVGIGCVATMLAIVNYALDTTPS